MWHAVLSGLACRLGWLLVPRVLVGTEMKGRPDLSSKSARGLLGALSRTPWFRCAPALRMRQAATRFGSQGARTLPRLRRTGRAAVGGVRPLRAGRRRRAAHNAGASRHCARGRRRAARMAVRSCCCRSAALSAFLCVAVRPVAGWSRPVSSRVFATVGLHRATHCAREPGR